MRWSLLTLVKALQASLSSFVLCALRVVERCKRAVLFESAFLHEQHGYATRDDGIDALAPATRVEVDRLLTEFQKEAMAYFARARAIERRWAPERVQDLCDKLGTVLARPVLDLDPAGRAGASEVRDAIEAWLMKNQLPFEQEAPIRAAAQAALLDGAHREALGWVDGREEAR